jgi:long-chain acyl-CoA synthetase
MGDYNFKTYNGLFDYITSTYDNPTFLNYLHNGEYQSISVQDFKEKVICLALALQKIGINKQDTVAIFADSSPFWLIFDFAIQKIGAISVPIFANISSKNLNFQIQDANINYIFIDNEERIKDIEKEHMVFITHKFCIKEENFYNVDEIFISTQATCDINDLAKSHFPSQEDTFSIIYTSGNTGTPKGVQLTHFNIINQLYDINTLIALKQEETILSLLPLAHIFERTVMSFYLSRGVSIYFVDEIPNVANLMKIVRPTMMTAVPRLLEKIFNKVKTGISQKPFISKIIASLAFEYAMQENMKTNTLSFKIYDKVVYSKLRELFGGRLIRLVTGGAPLVKEIYQFFVNIGVPLYQGYGLTESSPVICTNYPGVSKVGSSGKAMPSVEINILENGELLARSPSIMKGYLNQPELTLKTVDAQGWLHTGDVASMDEEGFIFIKSRLKDIFKTSTGEYVSTIPIEQGLAKNRYVEFATVIANNRQYVTALLFVDKELYENQKKTHNMNIEAFFHQDKVTKSIEKHIHKLNTKLNAWEKIVKYKIMTQDISIEGGELTPSMKICRGKIEEKYEDIINSMY